MIRQFDAPLVEAVRRWHSAEHKANRSPNGLMGLGADITQESQQAAIASWQSRLTGKIQEVDDKFRGRTFTAAEIRPEIAKVFQIAGEFAKIAKTINNITEDELRRIDYIFIDLGELYAFFGVVASGKAIGLSDSKDYPPSYVFAQGDPYWQKALDLEKAPIAWLIGVGKPVLENQVHVEELIRKAEDIPGRAIRWIINQAVQGLGLPKEVVPVIGGAVVIGLGVWAYFTFLEPIRRSTRAYARR